MLRYRICVATASFVVQLSVKPSVSRLVEIRFGIDGRCGVVHLDVRLARLVDGVDDHRACAVLVLHGGAGFAGSVRRADPEPAVNDRCCGGRVLDACEEHAFGVKPTPVTAWLAGAAPVVLVKLPGLTLTPFSASETTREAAALVAFVKFTVKPSVSIDTHDAFFCTASALSKK